MLVVYQDIDNKKLYEQKVEGYSSFFLKLKNVLLPYNGTFEHFWVLSSFYSPVSNTFYITVSNQE